MLFVILSFIGMLLIKNSYEWWFLVDFLLPPQELFYYIINDNLANHSAMVA